MSQAVITKAFSEWKAQQAVNNQPVTLDEFIFAYIPDLDVTKPIDNTEGIPAADKIVHRQAVSKSGVVNANSVVYSVTLGADVGDFSFNWIGLINKATSTLAMIIHAPVQAKVKNASGQQGNVLVRSMLMEYSGAVSATQITTPAETWQIDFTARLAAVDERQRLENIDLYGAAAFFDTGYLVSKNGSQFFVTQGAGYVAGLRSVLAANQNITVSTKPVKVWLDVAWSGTLTSEWTVQSKITVAASLADYAENGVQHHVFALASIDASGNITDLRPKGTLNEQAASDALAKHEKSRNHPDATTSEKGFTQLSSETNSDSESKAATPKAVKEACKLADKADKNADSRLLKENNLEDVPDKGKAREALELKGAATREVTASSYDTTAGRVLKVADYGWGTVSGLTALKSIFDITCTAKYAALGAGAGSSATEGMPANSGNTRFSVDVDNVYTNQYWVTLRSTSQTYVGLVNAANKTASWTQFYSEKNKPSASDVDAVSASQGGTFQKPVQFNQPAYFAQGVKLAATEQFASIGYGADAASFENANLLLKSWYGIGFYSTHPSGGELGITGYVDVRIGRLQMKEQIIPGNYANFDGRYYTKTLANATFQPKGSYGAPDTSGISGNVLWWKNTATGVITMMGQTAGVANGGRVTFPFAFPTKCYGVVPTRNNPTGNAAAMQPYDVNTTGWNLRIAGGGTETVMWIAMGK